MRSIKFLMIGVLSIMLGVAIFACSTRQGSPPAAEKTLMEKIMGKWILSEMDIPGVGTILVPANEKIVLTFADDNKVYLTTSRTDKNKKWDNHIPCELKVNDSTFILTATTVDGLVDATLKILSITENDLKAYLDFKITADDTAATIATTQRFTKAEDYSKAIVGMWEGHVNSDGSGYDDNKDHRWEYKDDGTYIYYSRNDDGNWVASETALSQYFVDGSLLCTRWESDGKEYREWWIINSIKDDETNWKALRLDDNGKPITATFSMGKVK